jgi:hypothetical protein
MDILFNKLTPEFNIPLSHCSSFSKPSRYNSEGWAAEQSSAADTIPSVLEYFIHFRCLFQVWEQMVVRSGLSGEHAGCFSTSKCRSANFCCVMAAVCQEAVPCKNNTPFEKFLLHLETIACFTLSKTDELAVIVVLFLR